jgi:AraC-like DNA-binding protein
VLAAVQTVPTWRADLVAGRRRLRVAVLAGMVAYLVVDTAMGLMPSLELAWSSGGQTIGLFALGLMAAWNSLGVAWEAPVRVAALPVGAATEAAPPADPVLLGRLEQMMTAERIYRQDGLTIGGLAVRLRVPEYRLRQAINEGLGYRNFNVFLNRYRIDEAKAALADATQREVPVLTIAMDAGFRSIGPFNRAFKAETGMTPSEFRRSAGER